MGFSTPLSGLKASATNLQVIGNNIANSQTTGFKESRAEFADVYANNMSLGNVARTQSGSGVVVADVAQQFTNGSVNSTNNSLDMAIKGDGFFVLADPNPNNINALGSAAIPSAYTRNGEFKLDSNGTVVNNQGQYLLAYDRSSANASDSTFSRGVFKPITIDASYGVPKPTANIDMKLNLNSTDTPPAVALFDRTNSKSYNYTTAVSIYDSEGNAHVASTYYVKDATTPNKWNMYLFVDDWSINKSGAPTDTSTVPAPDVSANAISLEFTTAGLLKEVDGVAAAPPALAPTNIDIGDIDLSLINPNLKVDPLKFDIDFAGGTQFAAKSSVNDLKQDGRTTGVLSSIDVDSEGVVFARYSNGENKALGQVALARFNSNQSLSKLGDTTWSQSAGSGVPIYGAAGTNNFGSIKGSALESSNVDLSEQLVKLIIAQQSYQANAQAITTEKSLLETILRT